MGTEMDEIWSLYADDGEQALNLVEEALLTLKEKPSHAAAVARLFRGMHTFKGNARLLGLSVIESRTHLAEDLIGMVRDEGMPLDAELLGLLLEMADALRGMLEYSVSRRRDVPEADSEALLKRMQDKLERCASLSAESPLAVKIETFTQAGGGGAAVTMAAPSEHALVFDMALLDHHTAASATETTETQADAAATNTWRETHAAESQDFMSRSMLEAIGEIITGHALARHMLAELAEDDPMQIVEAELRAVGGDWSRAREMVSQRLRERQDRFERLVQQETQLADRLDRLQEEAITVRSRPASLLLKPLASFGETLARNHQRQIRVTTAGDDISLDFSLLESFKGPMQTLVSFLATASLEAERIHIMLTKNDDHVAITLEDDAPGLDMEQIAERVRQLGWKEPPSVDMVLRDGFGKIGSMGEGVDFAELRRGLRLSGGDLRIVRSLTGGVQFHATLPLAMVVLDGMVVRVGEVIYVVPINAIQLIVHPTASAMLKVSAGGGGYMLKLENDDVLPVRFLMRDGERHHSFGGVPSNFVHAEASVDEQQKLLFVVAGNQSNRVALSIDELIGQQLVLIRPLQGYLSGIRGVTGCALLGSGGVGMVLDMGFVLNQARAA